MQDLLGTCMRYVPFLAQFLHNLAPILARSCKKYANLQVIILAASLAKSCTISCKICARLCKNHARKGTYRVHVPSKSCMQDSCMILQVRFCWVRLNCVQCHQCSQLFVGDPGCTPSSGTPAISALSCLLVVLVVLLLVGLKPSVLSAVCWWSWLYSF